MPAHFSRQQTSVPATYTIVRSQDSNDNAIPNPRTREYEVLSSAVNRKSSVENSDVNGDDIYTIELENNTDPAGFDDS